MLNLLDEIAKSLRGFIKKTPQEEIERAEKYRADYLRSKESGK